MTQKKKIGVWLSCILLTVALVGGAFALYNRPLALTVDMAGSAVDAGEVETLQKNLSETADGSALCAGEGSVSGLNYNMPNSAWWVSQWLGNGENIIAASRGKQLQKGADGFVFAQMNEEARQIEVVCGGYIGDLKLSLQQIQSTVLGNLSKVRVTVESVRFTGSLASMVAPVPRQSYTVGTEKDAFSVVLTDMALCDVYHIVIAPAGTEQTAAVTNEKIPVRYESEDGQATGGAKKEQGFVGELAGADAALACKVEIPQTGTYQLNFVYSNTPGKGAMPGFASQSLLVDGEQAAKLSYPPTGNSSFSSTGVTLDLEQGSHTLLLKEWSGAKDTALSLDCVDVTLLYAMREEPPVAYNYGVACPSETTPSNNAFFAVAPADGYYNLTFSTGTVTEETVVYKIDGVETGVVTLGSTGETNTIAYLRRGVNRVEIAHKTQNIIKGMFMRVAENGVDAVSESAAIALSADSAVFAGSAVRETAANPTKTVCIGGLSAQGSVVSLPVTAETAGTYRLTLSYAAYQPDLSGSFTPQYLNVEANGVRQRVFCSDTFGADCFRSITITVELQAGENLLQFEGTGNPETTGVLRLGTLVLAKKCVDQLPV